MSCVRAVSLLLPASSFTHPPPPSSHTLSLHDALPISWRWSRKCPAWMTGRTRSWSTSAAASGGRCRCRPSCCCWRCSATTCRGRSEEHTSELQSREKLVCRLLLEKKKKERQHRHNSDH